MILGRKKYGLQDLEIQVCQTLEDLYLLDFEKALLSLKDSLSFEDFIINKLALKS